MSDKKYVLCVKVKDPKTNLFEWKKIASASLIALMKYTTYCVSADELLLFMPNNKPVYSKAYLENLASSFHDKNEFFSIRTSELKGSKSLPILYKKDIDVLLVDKKELVKALISIASVSLEECLNKTISPEKERVLKELYNIFVTEEVRIKMSDNAFKELNPDGYPNRLYEEPLKTNWMALGLLGDNLKVLAESCFLNASKKQQLALFIKNNGGKLINDMSKEEEEKRLLLIERQLEKQKETNYFIRNEIDKNVSGLKPITIQTKNQMLDERKTREEFEEIDSFNSFYDPKYCNFSEDESAIIAKINELKKQKEEMKHNPKIRDNIDVKESITNINLKISELNYKLNCIMDGTMSYSDAGFLIEEPKKD